MENNERIENFVKAKKEGTQHYTLHNTTQNNTKQAGRKQK
jgi:hypothetical protein